MDWIKIDHNNLPEHEVLAANFKPGSHGYREKAIGYLCRDGDGETDQFCENANEILENCTHYIDINAHDIIE